MYFILFLLFTISCGAQVLPGARQAGLAHSDVSFNKEAFAVFNNCAGSAQVTWDEIGLFHSPSPFGLKELASTWIAYSHSFGSMSLSGGFMTYGYDLYRENRFALSFSAEMSGSIYLGASLGYNSISIKNYGSAGALSVNAGVIALVSSLVRIGFTASNITQATIGSEPGQLPVIIQAGLGLSPDDKLLFHLALKKELTYKFSLAAGFEYTVFNLLSVRAGTCSDPVSYSAGTGIEYGWFRLDYAVNIHQDLGLTHQVGLMVSFRDNQDAE